MLAPSLSLFATPEPSQEEHGADTERPVHLRAQAAVVRALTDHIARFAHPDDAERLREQLDQERDRLGRFEEEAARLSTSTKTSR
jgi:hypothetical protein